MSLVGLQLGSYRLTRLLGQGGFADVYLGEHIHLNTQVAIKVLQGRMAVQDLDDFKQEAQTIANLNHAHILRILDFGVEGRIPFIVMDYAPKGTLRDRHPRGSILPISTVLAYLKQIAPALYYAHEQKIIHRDIKPDNILIDTNNSLLLSDFGIALETQSSHHQNDAQIAGTAVYMAPEQFQGKPRRASDQYALGIVVYEWLCGTRPFQGSFTELASQHLFVSPPSLRQKIPVIPSEVEHVVMRALAKKPEQRFADVETFARSLAQASQVSMPVVLSPADKGDRQEHESTVITTASSVTNFFTSEPSMRGQTRNIRIKNIIRMFSSYFMRKK